MRDEERIYRQFAKLVSEGKAVKAAQGNQPEGSPFWKELEKIYDANFDQRYDLKSQMDDLTPTIHSVAAIMLMDASQHGRDAYADQVDVGVLRHVQPSLAGMIREHVDLLLSIIERNPLAKIEGLPFYC